MLILIPGTHMHRQLIGVKSSPSRHPIPFPLYAARGKIPLGFSLQRFRNHRHDNGSPGELTVHPRFEHCLFRPHLTPWI